MRSKLLRPFQSDEGVVGWSPFHQAGRCSIGSKIWLGYSGPLRSPAQRSGQSDGDEFSQRSQSLRIPITRGERHDRHLHLRRLSSLDGYGAASGNWTGYWGKQCPELLDHRLALYGEEQRMVFGANTYRAFARMLASSTEESEVRDPWVTRMRSLPATVVSTTLDPSTGRTRPSWAVTPSMSSPDSRRSPRCRCARTAACR